MQFWKAHSGNGNTAVIGHKGCPQLLVAMAKTTKEAVAMEITLSEFWRNRDRQTCRVSLYHPSRAARRERLRLSAIAEQGQTETIGDSTFVGFARYAALFKHGEKPDFVFECRDPFLRDLGLSIARNANLVQCLRVEVQYVHRTLAHQILEALFSVEGAFPSLQSVYLNFHASCGEETYVPPHIMKHVRGIRIWEHSLNSTRCAKQVGSMIRNKDCGIEEVYLSTPLQAELLDDTLSSVCSLKVDSCEEGDAGLFVGSLERTKAEGGKLVRVSFRAGLEWRPAMATLIETIVRSRPNLQVLELSKLSLSTFNVLCDVVAPSVLTTLKVGAGLHAEIDGRMLAGRMGKLLQHPTIRDLDLAFDCQYSQIDDTVLHDLVQSVAEGLRVTRLRRFHWTMLSGKRVSSATMTKLCECVRENRNLMDIRLEGGYWLSSSKDPYPCPITFLDFVSLRNQYLSQVLMRDENTVPSGLWPLILESASCDASVLYYLLTLRPHFVKGNVKRTADADAEKSMDGLKRIRRN